MKNGIMNHKLKGALALGGLCALLPSALHGQGIGEKKLADMRTKTQQMVERGELVYSRQCATCHGEKGANDTPYAAEFGLEQGGFTNQVWKHGGGLIQIYDIISKKQAGVEHPVYSYLPYQDRWAVSHYIRELAPGADPSDPTAVVERATFEAINGVCDDEIKTSISDRVKLQGDEQLKKGAELYAANCASCHGEKGLGNGAAAAALNPKPRNFAADKGNWKNTSSPLGIFKTLANGIAGGSMASYSNLPEEDRWALTHYVREQYVPADKRVESTSEQIVEVCRTLSAPAKPKPISVDLAMEFMVKDAEAARTLRRQQYGRIDVTRGADPIEGKKLYDAFCSSCHGPEGQGMKAKGPYGSFPPYLYLEMAALGNEVAGGSFEVFADRSMKGAHATLPDMSGAATLSARDWQNLHAYVAEFEGSGRTGSVEDEVPAPTPTPEDGTAPTEGTPTDGTAPEGGTAPAEGTPEAPKKEGADATPE